MRKAPGEAIYSPEAEYFRDIRRGMAKMERNVTARRTLGSHSRARLETTAGYSKAGSFEPPPHRPTVALPHVLRREGAVLIRVPLLSEFGMGEE
jgi:hypothetical protein